MAVNKNDYNQMDRLAIAIYLDYGLNVFPLDIFYIAKRMGVKLISYSSFDDEQRSLLIKKSNDGFYAKTSSGPLIYYNDLIEYKGKIRLTIAHELKHYVCEDVDVNEDSEKLAEHFARYLLCPTPYLIYAGIEDVYEIIDMFGLTYTAASNALEAAMNRKRYYGNQIFDYEQSLIDLFIK